MTIANQHIPHRGDPVLTMPIQIELSPFRPKIVAISGMSGAGKSTLARSLATQYNSSYLGWDDFDTISKHPRDYLEWFRSGKDYTQWDYPELATTLCRLRMGETFKHPVIDQQLKPTALVFFDAPLGRLHPQTATWIDLVCHISVARDIMLCRRLIRDIEANQDTPELEDLLDELRFYAREGHLLFDDTSLVETSDIVLDGLLPVASQLVIVDKLLRKRGLIR